MNSTVIYTSTNKVYGNLDSNKVKINKNRYVYKNNIKGIDEENKTDFHSPPMGVQRVRQINMWETIQECMELTVMYWGKVASMVQINLELKIKVG